ncbi:oligosaccharide flippase family protein [Clostridium aestuarii]|uniref:Oligosaccharide flippase family protein n=1 Tax=Clostridium aestuarii TaxID=338193 RepID=A0ABT4CX47_9CLOT|nr:oligosaccharide flippase family protein [Clostridium aestuarii]MCY6483569.1 oligosaccharide flippase family protein [Clostridium aestuarii]
MIKEITSKLYKNKLVKSGFWYTIGTLFLQGISFLTAPIFINILTTSEYGVVQKYNAWFAIFTIVVSLGLVSSVSRSKFDFEDKYDDFLSSVLLLASIVFVICLTIGMLFRNQIAGVLFNKGIAQITTEDTVLVLFLIIQGFFTFIINFCNTKFTVLYKYREYLFVAITSALMNVIVSIIFIKNLSCSRYMSRIGAVVLVNVLYGMFLYVFTIRKGKISINKEYWKYALGISIPLIPHVLSAVILSSFDRIMLGNMIDDKAAGIYSFAYTVAGILYVIWTALNKAWVPYFFENMKKENFNDIKKKYKNYIMIFSLITFMMIFVSPEIGKIIAFRSPNYWRGLNLIPIILFSNYFVFLYSLPSNLEFYMKKTYLISIGTISAGILNIILNYIFIPKLGYIASAWTTLISYIVLFIYHYIMANRMHSKKIFEAKYFGLSIVFMLFVCGVFYFIKDNWLIRYIFVLLIFSILAYKSKNFIKTYLRQY